MTTITPVFSGSYNGDLIYSAVNYTVNSLCKYIESMDIVYDETNINRPTGFTDTKYIENNYDATKATGSISLTLTGDIPHWLSSQLIQLSKACLAGGMSLSIVDDWATDKTYLCKWENAGDFAENDAVTAAGNLSLRFYQVT